MQAARIARDAVRASAHTAAPVHATTPTPGEPYTLALTTAPGADTPATMPVNAVAPVVTPAKIRDPSAVPLKPVDAGARVDAAQPHAQDRPPGVAELGSRALVPVDLRYLPPAHGMRNRGSICWALALMQSLLSLPQLNEYIVRRKEVLCDNVVVQAYARMFTDAGNLDTGYDVVDAMRACESIRTAAFTLASGEQQCAHEGFAKFLEALNLPSAEEKFYNELVNSIECKLCMHRIESPHRVLNTMVNLHVLPKWPHQCNNDTHACALEFRRQLVITCGVIDEFKCSKCNGVSKNAIQVGAVKTIRELVAVMFVPQMVIKRPIWFPDEFPMPHATARQVRRADGTVETRMVSDVQLIYRCYAVIHHSGGNNGGHYWAECRRAGGTDADTQRLYRIDDSQCREIPAFSRSSSVVIVFYALDHVVPVRGG